MNRFRRILNIIFALAMVMMLITATMIEENSTLGTVDFNVDLSEGWITAGPDGSQTEVSFPYRFQDGTDTLCITRTLPTVPDYAVILVKCNYRSLTAYVDGVEIYHSLPSTFGAVETDLGHYTALIPLSSEYSGKEIVLNIEERTSGYNSDIKYISLTSAAQHGFQTFERKAFHLVSALVMLLCAAAALIVWFVFWLRKRIAPEESYHALLWISLFSASVGLWILSDTHIMAISSGAFTTSGIVNYLSLSLMPVSFLGILQSICSKKLLSLRWIVIASKVLLISLWTLFLTGLVDFSSMLFLLHASCIIAVVIFAVFVVWKRSLFLVGNALRYGIWAVLGMVAVTVAIYWQGGDWMPWALCGMFILLVATLVSTLTNVSRAMKDISQTRQYKEFALTDIMTGLKSRYAYTIFEAEHKQALPPKDLCLIFLDIDMLKKANDTFGHAAGDELITATSNCIRQAFGDSAECFRMGGDEFLVAMNSEAAAVEERIALFDRLVSQWSGTYMSSLTVSYGIASAWDFPDLNFDELLRAADYAMYQNKKQCGAYQ